MFISTVAIRSKAVGMASMKISRACCLPEGSSCSTTRFARQLRIMLQGDVLLYHLQAAAALLTLLMPWLRAGAACCKSWCLLLRLYFGLCLSKVQHSRLQGVYLGCVA